MAQMENFASSIFTGGMRQRYTLSIKDSSLIITGASISAWDEGGSLEEIIIKGEEQSK